MGIWRDLRYAARRLARDWRFTLAAAFTLSLGIGANATVFTITNAMMLRELPFTDHGRVVSMGSHDATGSEFGVSFLDFQDWRENTKTVAGMAMWGSYTLNVSDAGRIPERYWGLYVSGNIFDLMGQKVALGRSFLPEDDQPGATPVTIVSHAMWQNRYGGSPDLIGRVVKISEIPATVIGVMPEGIRFPPNTDVWLPLSLMPPAVRFMARNARNYAALGRLADGVTLEQARAELNTIGESLERSYGDTNKGVRPSVMTYDERIGGNDGTLFGMLMGAVAFVMLIACANVANLLLARSAGRTREVGVRVALGASRWQIVRQLLVESLLLACLSGVLGIIIGIFALRVFVLQIGSLDLPYWVHFTMDGWVLGYIAAICVASAVLFGLAPALHVSRTNVQAVLKEGGRTGSGGARARQWASVLVTVELALTLVLLSGAGIMMRSFMSMYLRDVGFNADNMLVMSLSLPSRKYPTPDARAAFYTRLEERLAGISVIQAGAVASHTPFSGWTGRQLVIDGRDVTPGQPLPDVATVSIGPKYFDAVGVRLLRGEPFTALDGHPGREHAIVNQDFVTTYFPNEDPIGQRIRLINPVGGQNPPWIEIVGVAPTVRQRNLQGGAPTNPVVYLPHQTQSVLFARLLVRTTGNAASVAPLVRTELGAIDPDIPVVDIMTMDASLGQQRQGPAIIGSMLSIFAFIAIVLASVGLYAVTSHSVVQRTMEIGIRLALGARPEQVRWLFFRRLLVQLTIGLVVGIAGSLWAGTALRAFIVDVSPFDPATLITTAVILIVVALAACFSPARRATRVDPIVALRYE